jgi:hypothetical protein
MLKTFADETNRDAKDMVFVMVGWTANVREWDEFAKSWRACLAEKPSIQYYKTSEANSLSGQFHTFNDEAGMEAKREALARVIASYKLNGYFTEISHKAFSQKPQRLRKLMGTRIYDWAFIDMVCGVLEDCLERGNPFEVIDFTFDGCPELRACIGSYEGIREHFPLSMRAIAGEAIPGDDKRLAGLQAADLLAGGISAHLKGQAQQFFRIIVDARRIVRLRPYLPPQLHLLFQYANQVYGRTELAHKTVKLLKERGIDLDDLK